MKKTVALFAVLLACTCVWAQTPVIVSKQTKMINGKNYFIHIVEKGQTIFSISRAYGVNYHDAIYKNDIDKIAIGDTIFLPSNEKTAPAKFHYHVVKQGNTLYSLAKEYQVEIDDILKLNPKIENNKIKVGEVIKIPMKKSESKKPLQQQQPTQANNAKQQQSQNNNTSSEYKKNDKEQEKLEKQQREAEAKAKKEQDRILKEVREREAKEQKELEKRQKEERSNEEKKLKELEKQQQEAEAREAKERKELEKKQKEAKEAELRAQKEREKQQKEREKQQREAEAAAKKEKERQIKEAEAKAAKEKKEAERRQKETEAAAKKEQERLQKESVEKQAKEKQEIENQKKELEKQRKELEKQQKDLEKRQKEFEKRQKEANNNHKESTEEEFHHNTQPQTNLRAEYRPVGRESQPSSDALTSPVQNSTPQAEPKKTVAENKTTTVANTEKNKPTPPQAKQETKPVAEQKNTPATTTENSTSTIPILPLQTAPNIGKSVPAPDVVIRNRVNNTSIQITLMIPLYLSNINEISTSKFDIEQRKKRKYKSFEFIQFYEGILLGLESLKNEGCNVVLNVVDIPGDLPEKVEQAFSSYNVAQSDLIIALLEKNAFEKAAQLAKENHVFILNPFSSRPEIIDQNPYVVKLAPSYQGTVSSLLSMVSKSYSSPNLYIVHSNGKLEKRLLDEFQLHLKNQNKIKYTIFDWSANAKLVNMLKASPDNNIVINIYDQTKDKNKTQSSLIMNRLFSLKKNTPTLITIPNWALKYEDIDYNQLQRLSYHFMSNSYLDYNNPKHKDFIDKFKEKYKTEPQGNYAALGNDIIIHFVSGINAKGTEKFWQDPNTDRRHSMIYHFYFKRSAPDKGFENQNAYFYRLNSKFQFVPAN